MALLAGRYETLRAIASGGMATVHLARAVGVGGFERLVAVKVMHAHLAEDPDFVAMFLDEARLAARIRHPNVVATIDVQKDPEGLFLVMEYVEGPSLRMLLREVARRNRRLPLEIGVRILVDALSGLHAAHELRGPQGQPLKLVHRDVSPANILVGTDGVVRLTDFGVARAESRISSTRGGQLKGKIPYMPPEQIMAEEIDRRADLYATGCVMWETLVGRRLFNAPNDGAMLHQILAGADRRPSQLRPEVPEAIDRVCMRALARRAEDRYATAAEFADDLEQAAAQADLRVATTRAVAALVTELGLHELRDREGEDGRPVQDWSETRDPAAMLEALADPLGLGADGEVSASKSTASAVGPPLLPAAEPGSGPHATGVTLDTGPSRSGTVASLTADALEPAPPAPARSRAAIVAILAVVGLGAATFVGWRLAGPGPAGAGPDSSSTGTPVASLTVSALPTSVPGDASARATAAATATATATTSTIASASAATTGARRPTGGRATATSQGVEPKPTARPTATSSPTSPPTSPTGYRPPTL